MKAKGGENALGRKGEEYVRQELERRGAQILASNWHCLYGELDLIAGTDREILFVEVKTRRSRRHGEAKEAVDWRKQQKLIHSAECYLMEHPEERRQPRFDVAEVYFFAAEGAVPMLNYYPGAFEVNEQ